jgi:hypothetical protein
MQNLLGTYPVRNVQELDAADNYFVAHKYDFSAADRRQYASELSGHMKEAGLTPSDLLLEYSGPRRSSIEAGISYRKTNSPEEYHSRLDSIEKIANYAPEDEVLHHLERIDNEIGINRRYHIVPDPVRTLYYSEKTASLADNTWLGDTDKLKQSALENWVQSEDYSNVMKRHFPYDMVNGLRDDPWNVFSSLPDPHKKIIARMCNDSSIGPRPAGRSMYDIGGGLEKEELHQPASAQLERLERLHGTTKDRIMSRLSRI